MVNSSGGQLPGLIGYTPTKSLQISVVVLFSIFAAALSVCLFTTKNKKWRFIIGVSACLVQTVGYGIGIASANSPDNPKLYTASVLLVLLPPTIFQQLYLYGSLVKYMKNKQLHYLNQKMKPKVMDCIFWVISILSLILKVVGGSLYLHIISNGKEGQKLLLGGLFVEAFELSILSLFPLVLYLQVKYLDVVNDWRILFRLGFKWLLFVIRICYLLKKYLGGYQNSVMLNEGLYYGLDVFPILVILIVSFGKPYHFIKRLVSNKKSQDNQQSEQPSIIIE